MTCSEAIKILGISDKYTEKELKVAYKNKIRKVHPDLNSGLKDATEKTQKINEAYMILKNSNIEYFDETYSYKELVICNLYLKLANNGVSIIYFNDEEFYHIYIKYCDNISNIYENSIKELKLCSNDDCIDILVYKLKININFEIKQFLNEIYKEYFEYNKNLFIKKYFKDKILLKILINNLNNECKKYIKNINKFEKIKDAMEYFVNSKEIILKNILIKSKIERYLYKKSLDEEKQEITIKAITILNELNYIPKDKEIKNTVKKLIKNTK